MNEFKDYFSTQSVDYAKYRPSYPSELFGYLASVAPHHETAWDCATGNGQAALGLAPFFDHVIATDPSVSQIANAVRNLKVTYQVASAEKTDIESHSIDLVTVAQALHWFDLDAFYQEANRLLKSGGVLAVWCYNLVEISLEIDRQLQIFYSDVVGPYWPPERRLVESHYRTMSFPFKELDPPRFYMQAHWSLSDLLGYLRTWSATQKFMESQKTDPIPVIGERLSKLWDPSGEEKLLRWPLDLRIGVTARAPRL